MTQSQVAMLKKAKERLDAYKAAESRYLDFRNGAPGSSAELYSKLEAAEQAWQEEAQWVVERLCNDVGATS